MKFESKKEGWQKFWFARLLLILQGGPVKQPSQKWKFFIYGKIVWTECGKSKSAPPFLHIYSLKNKREFLLRYFPYTKPSFDSNFIYQTISHMWLFFLFPKVISTHLSTSTTFTLLLQASGRTRRGLKRKSSLHPGCG